MSPERFARVRDLFDRACGVERSARAGFLDRECGGDTELRTRVLGLLDAEERAADFSDPDRGAIIRTLLAADASGGGGGVESIGPYRVLGVIGRGGMGVVYLAEQGSPQRRVALKVLPAGLDSATLASWFGREVRLLGRLEHPGIARIYDAGSAPTPRGAASYFAMEYIEGPRLADFARERGLGPRERAALIAAVADAVQHAHTKGVVHRDLKPANILVRDAAVGGEGPGAARPVILDFGVARAVESGAGDTPGCGAAPSIAEAGMVIGTVAYMSPEQLDGDNEAVDARADVYALGVILYELLAGRLPHDVRGRTPGEAARLVRGGAPAPLGAALDEDLRIIVTRAIEGDRERRYATAAALAEDLRRYLRDEPISARRASAAYQLRKFAARNRGLVFTAAAGVLALAGGLAASAAMYVREQRAHERAEGLYASEQAARRAADDSDRLNSAIRGYMIDGLLMAAAPDRMGHDAKMLDVLSRAAEGLHERFAEHPEVEAGVRMDLARVLGAVGKYAESDEQWGLAIPLIERCSGPDSRAAIAALIGRAGVLHELRHRWAAIRAATEALDRARRVGGLPALEVQALNRIGAAYEAEGRHAAALGHLREGLALAEASPVENAAVIPSLMTYINSAEKNRGNREEALEMTRRIVAFSDTNLGAETPTAIMARHNLILDLLETGRAPEAAEVASTLPSAAERAFAPNHLGRAQVHRACGEAMRQVGRRQEAERLFTAAAGEFGATFSEVSVDRELCYDGLWRLYASWPGHEAEFREAAVQALASRFQHMPFTRALWMRRFLGELDSSCTAMGIASGGGQWFEAVWARRDEWAPEGHPNRAMFFANFARFAEEAPDRPHGREAAEQATASLAYAKRPGAAESILRAANRP